MTSIFVVVTALVVLSQCCAQELAPEIFPPIQPQLPPTTTPRPKVPATYWVTLPTTIRPGRPLAVAVHLLDPAATSRVSVTLRNSSDETVIFSRAPITLVNGGGSGSVINLEIPRTLKYPDWRYGGFSYIVRVIGLDGLRFNQSKRVYLNEKAFSVFVQTDKAVYKPGETVKFRALAMNPDLSILKEPMDIFIRDPNGNGIKQWRNVIGVQNTGVVEKRLPTSTDPPLGDWSIDITVLGHTQTKTFTIAEYVLPKFEAAVDVPEVVLTSEPGLRGVASAKYTFGKPLTDATVEVTVKFPYFYSEGIQPTVIHEGTLDQNGQMPFMFTKKELQELTMRQYTYRKYNSSDEVSLTYVSLVVVANITDVRTGQKMGAEGRVRFSEEQANVEFLPITSYTYKPGLTYTAHLQVTKPDGSLFTNYQNIWVNFNITMSVLAPTTTTTTTTTQSPPIDKNSTDLLMKEWNRPLWRPPPPENTIVLATTTKGINANGFVSVDVEVPAVAVRLSIDASTMGVSRYISASPAASGSEQYLQIVGQKQNPKVGENVVLTVKTTETVGKVNYQVYSKGTLISESNAQAQDIQGQNFIVSFPVMPSMAPNCLVLVFYFRSDGEVVADSMSFKVDSPPDSLVQVSYDRQKVKPGDDVQMTVKVEPQSVVFLLAVDKSVKLLKSGNDITKDLVNQELIQYDYGAGFNGFWRYMVFCGWPYPSRGSDAYSIFQDAKVAMLTDGDLYQKSYGDSEWPTLHRTFVNDGGIALAAEGASSAHPPPDSPVERVRKFFPETWLWEIVTVGNSGQVVTKQTAPDTITTWLTSAFSIHPQYGLSVIDAPAELTTFREIFVSLDMPYSAKRNEDLCIKAFVFNYYSAPLPMTVTMGYHPSISAIRVFSRAWWTNQVFQFRAPMPIVHRIREVKPNDVGETLFCFRPTEIGQIPINVNVTTQGLLGDGVERLMLVKPEGVPRTENIPVILDLRQGATFQRDVAIAFPADTVAGSQRLSVSLAGDLLGPVFENLDDLLRMPYGCGEQNMLYFAPNVFLIDYLQRTGTYTPEVAEKAENYMMVGYQKEIKYQHTDGSYSAFGEGIKNVTGSMWLTAFVTKCFVQSMALQGDVVSIEPRFVNKSINWMLSYQSKDGFFHEPGKVFNKNMQGGSANGEALTAYVLIALSEAKQNFNGLTTEGRELLDSGIERAQAYLEQQLPSLTDSYDLAIVAYALKLTSSLQAKDALRMLKAKAVNEPLTVHWERPKTLNEQRYYWQRQTDAINIEMTAYALLTYLAHNDVAGSLPIVRWMTSQRGPQGGFISTQDTVTGLQALAQVSKYIYQKSFTPVLVTVEWFNSDVPQTRTMVLNDNTKLLLQTIDLPIQEFTTRHKVTIKANIAEGATFNGLALAEVTMDYTVRNPAKFTTYSLLSRVELVNSDNFVVHVQASRIDGRTGSMTVIEVGIPTGYSVDVDGKLDTTGAQMKEVGEDKFILYYDSIGSEPVFASIPMTVSKGAPVNTDPVPVRIYDYYENAGSQQMTITYQLPTTNSICERQPNYERCPLTRSLGSSFFNL